MKRNLQALPEQDSLIALMSVNFLGSSRESYSSLEQVADDRARAMVESNPKAYFREHLWVCCDVDDVGWLCI